MTPETVVIVEEPLPLASVTVLPETGWDCASSKVTVTVEVATPFAVTEAGAALTVDCAAVTGPTVKRDRRRLGDGDRSPSCRWPCRPSTRRRCP